MNSSSHLRSQIRFHSVQRTAATWREKTDREASCMRLNGIFWKSINILMMIVKRVFMTEYTELNLELTSCLCVERRKKRQKQRCAMIFIDCLARLRSRRGKRLFGENENLKIIFGIWDVRDVRRWSPLPHGYEYYYKLFIVLLETQRKTRKSLIG